jgi:hypothetical protein
MKILLACLALLSVPALAQEASSLFAAPVAQKSLVPVRGVVTGAPESVTFTGNAVVLSRLAPDPDFNRPRVVLTLDLTGVAGTGAQSGAKYVISGPEFTQRQVAASHAIEFTFPFKSNVSAAAATARTGVASFVLDFNVSTGAVTGASASVTSPNFPR